MTKPQIQEAIERAYHRSKKEDKFPDHVLAQAGFISMKAGVIGQEAYENKYQGKSNKAQIQDAAIQTIVACLRMLEQK